MPITLLRYIAAMVRIGVVGAGVVGLTTASLLQEAIPGAEVVVIADKFLTETTSTGAAGLFRPGSNLRGPNPEITRKWVADSFNYYKKFLENPEGASVAGVKEVAGYQFSSRGPEITENEHMQRLSSEYRKCTDEELNICNGDFKYGTYFKTVLTECTKYMPYLTSKILYRGGRIIERHLETFEELCGQYDLVCNCTGFGAKRLCNDNAMSPIRGQIYKVRAPWIKTFYFVDYNTYIIPGFEYVTLGGCRDFDSYDTDVNKYDSASILERCTNLLPSLKNAEIVKEWVGLRPYRTEIRVEKEIMDFPGGRTLKIVHNYGHGGYGVLVSPGTSMHAVQLVKQMLSQHWSKL